MNAPLPAQHDSPEAAIRSTGTEELRHAMFAIKLSLAIGFSMLFMKIYAYVITGSAAILSDAAESVVHIFAVGFAAYSMRLSFKPPDEGHMYGHDKIGFFSAGFEGAMIILAAIYIMYESIAKWIAGLQLENLGVGTIFVALATVTNGALGWYLIRQGKRFRSIVLEANGRHVLTDSWTSLGVVIALGLTYWTGWLPFDPIIAILVAINILWSGGRLMRRSIGGLMDETDRRLDTDLRKLLSDETQKYGIQFHDLRHRNAGNKILIEFHLLFHSGLPIATAHEQATAIELQIKKRFGDQTEILTHLEPLEGHDEVHEKTFHPPQEKQPLG